jgi:translation initiation factor 4G
LAQALRAVKGILNKLTPEKFERLFKQLLEVVATVDVLQTTISLVFENAVAQPTFCAMYADLCLALSKELPSFPPPPGACARHRGVALLLGGPRCAALWRLLCGVFFLGGGGRCLWARISVCVC